MIGICRFCASLRKDDLLVEIDDDIRTKVKLCCQVNVGLQDLLPTSICAGCQRSLNAAYEFYKLVHDSEESLKELLLKANKRSPQVTRPETKLFDGEVTLENSNVDTEILKFVSDDLKAENRDIGQQTNFETNSNREKYESEIVLIEVDKCASGDNENSNDELISELSNEHDSEEWMDDALRNDDLPTDSQLQISSWKMYSWMCFLCSYSGDSLEELKDHASSFHNCKSSDIEFKCADCQKICDRYYKFLNHIRRLHHTQLANRCDLCDAHFDSFAKLKEHRENRCNLRSLTAYPMCIECGKIFATKHSLQTHTRLQHVRNPTVYQCSICQKEFSRLGVLKAHYRVHSDERTYACQICGRSFRHKINLNVHLQSHTSGAAYECSICNKGFKNPTNLGRHLRIHNDIKDFKCDYCDKTFRSKDTKVSHERIHTGAKPFACEYCGRQFRFRSTFMTHLTVHTGDYPYNCAECDHSFSNWSNYNKHLKRMHTDEKGKAKQKSARDRKPNAETHPAQPEGNAPPP